MDNRCWNKMRFAAFVMVFLALSVTSWLVAAETEAGAVAMPPVGPDLQVQQIAAGGEPR